MYIIGEEIPSYTKHVRTLSDKSSDVWQIEAEPYAKCMGSRIRVTTIGQKVRLLANYFHTFDSIVQLFYIVNTDVFSSV